MKHSLALQISILILIMVSGCTLPGAKVSNYGIVLEDFVAEPNELQSNEPFTIRARIRNIGRTRAENVFVKLFNTDIGMYSDLQCTPSFGTTSNCEVYFDLLGEDTEKNLQGESMTCTWNCIAPILEKGVSVTYNPSIRIYYSYVTTTTKPLLIASQDELKRLQSQGQAIPSQPSTTTGGPVSLDIKVKGPVKFWEGMQQVEFPIEIDVQNVGEGTACTLEGMSGPTEGCDNPDNWNKVILLPNTPEIMFKNCDLETGKALLSLWNQRGKIVCEANMNIPMYTKNIQKNIEILVVYDYFTDKSIPVVVKGTADIEVF